MIICYLLFVNDNIIMTIIPMKLDKFIGLQQQSMVLMATYFNELMTNENVLQILMEIQKEVERLDNIKYFMIYSMNLSELKYLKLELNNILSMVQSNIQQEIVKLWIEHELGKYSESVDYLRVKRASAILQQRWKKIFKKKCNAVSIIQKVWRESISNPTYHACRNRLLWEFEN